MLLNKLVIINWKTIVREISFKRGLNLITSVWNSVWKTTLLRSIDFCFGSDGKDFYQDSEFKNNDNKLVFKFLTVNKITFKLFFSIEEKEYEITRRFDTLEWLSINGKKYSNLDIYKQELNRIIFGIEDTRPSFRNMLSKFIRKDILKMKNMIKTLHFSASKDDYILLFFNLFHFKEPNLIYQVAEIRKEKTKLSGRLKAIKWNNTKNSLKQKIKLFDNDIWKIEEKIKSFNLIKAGDYSLDKLKEIQKQIYMESTEKSQLNFKLWLNNESLLLLEKQKSSIQVKYIEEIYKSAEINVWKLQNNLKDTINFHNKMVINKLSFIKKQIGLIEDNIKIVNKKLRTLQAEEGNILRSIWDKDKFSSLYQLQHELSEKSQKKWEEKKILDLINELEEKIDNKKEQILNISKKVDQYTKDFDDNIFIFNKYFSEFSQKLYNQKYLISFSDDYKDILPENIDFNVWWWEKKAYIWLFDLAYISYVDEKKWNYPKFVLHDSTEDTNSLSLENLFKIANTINGQYIVSLLEDKIKTIGKDKLKWDIILSLNNSNKFFNID